MSHIPVLLTETITALNIKKNGTYIDGTFGRGGHSQAILSCLNENGKLYVMDKDTAALDVANKLAATDTRVEVVEGCFSSLGKYIVANNLAGKVDGILLDIGVSSPQLDESERGFSFMQDGPLDMRMATTGITAAEWINSATLSEIAHILKIYGEEPFAQLIAKHIVAVRENEPFTRTLQLANVIENCIPTKVKRKLSKHPATRSFQAIRIHINDELNVLKQALAELPYLLAPQGRLAFITFHSLEDRIVKQTLNELTVDNLPRNIPRTDANAPKFKWAAKKVKASKDELELNPRARSATLRVIGFRAPLTHI